MRFPVRLVSAILVLAVLAAILYVVSIGFQKPEPPPEVPEAGEAPAGYDAYISAGDAAFAKDFAQQISEFGDDPATGNRSSGSLAELEASKLIEQTMKDIGLKNVTVDSADADGWTFGGANLTFVDADGEIRQATLGGFQTNIIEKNKSVPVVDLKSGTAADYEGLDVTGKLVLIDIDTKNDWWINYPAYQAYVKGAKAVLAVNLMEEAIGDRLVSQDICGPSYAPVLSISMDDAAAVRAAIEKNGYTENAKIDAESTDESTVENTEENTDESGQGESSGENADENTGDNTDESGNETPVTKQIDVQFNASSTVVEGTATHNVWGEIPGKTDEVIYFIAHYDAYYHAFYDDAIGVGLIISMAKAFIESGYEPEKTLRFLTHGAEEWGKTNSEADWAHGAYEQIVNIHPEWAENAFALINIDGGYPLADMENFNVSVPYEFRPFIARTIKTFGDRSDVTISEYGGLPSTEREDFIYNAMGVPTIANDGGDGSEHYFNSMFHSNMDVLEEGGYSEAAANAIARFYGFTAFTLDQLPFMPLDFSVRFEAMNKLADENRSKFVKMDPHLIANTLRAGEASDKLIEYITAQNDKYKLALQTGDTATVQEITETAEKINPDIHKIYRDIQDTLLRLDWKFTYEFAGTGVRYNIDHLTAAIEYLKNGDAETALYEELSYVDLAKNAISFDKETCDYFYDHFEESLKGTWAEGRTVGKLCYADDVVRSLMKKIAEKPPEGVAPDYAKEIKELEGLLAEQHETIGGILTESSEVLAILTDDIYALLDVYDIQE